MKTEQIIYLNDIAQTNSITQTAQRFFISQQALSSTIKKLEDEFNATFLQRTNKGVILTEEGKYFLSYATGILETYFKIKDDLSYLSVGTPPTLTEGELHIYCHTRVLGTLLIDILEQFRKRYPHISISLKEKENIETIDGVSQKKCDLGIIFAPDFLINNEESLYAPNTPNSQYHLPANVDLQILFSDKFIACMSKQHPLANKDFILQKDFANTPLVLFDTHPLLSASEDEQSLRYYSNNIQFHKDMLLKGLAISTITSFEFRKLYLKYKTLTAIPMESQTKSNITLVTNTDCALNPQAQLFIKMLKNYDFYRI